MARTIVFIHGAWVTPRCWDPFLGYFRARGHRCVAPAWPHRDRSVQELRSTPPAELPGLGIAEIVDHYAALIRAEPEPPVLIGHSFGGLFAQILLDRGLGSAGVAIDPAPPRGVLPLQWSAIRASSGVLLTWAGWRRVVRMSLPEFQYAFVNALTEREQKRAYEEHVVPESGRIFFQAALSMLSSRSPARVDFANPNRPPLLITAGGADNVVPAAMNRANFRKYAKSAAVTDFKEFGGRCHWLIAQPGWEEVAGFIAGWLDRQSLVSGAQA